MVFKTRARRLYDIANALAALGLVEKVNTIFTVISNDNAVPIPQLIKHAPPVLCVTALGTSKSLGVVLS